MANIVLKDLEKQQELDMEAMRRLRGGFFVASSRTMAAWSGPWGAGMYQSASSMVAAGMGPFFGPFGPMMGPMMGPFGWPLPN